MNPVQLAFPKEHLSNLGNSGFPFQTAVVATIKTVGSIEVEEEVAWKDSDGSNKFLDVVASVDQVRICIECKAFRNEQLVFLLPTNTGKSETADIYAIHVGRVQDSTRRPIVAHGLCRTRPLTPESVYCVAVGKSSNKESRLIEREAQPLVRGTEEYAKDRCRQIGAADYSVVCVPVLLTTASLFVTEYDPLDISLNDGIYQARDEHIRPVPFIRLTKEFTAHSSTRTRLRTIIVAQAAHLKELVNDLGNVCVGDHVGTWATIYDSVGGEVDRKR